MKRFILLLGLFSILLTLFIHFFIFGKVEQFRYTEFSVPLLIVVMNIPFIIGGTLFKLIATAVGKSYISVPIVIVVSWVYDVWDLVDLDALRNHHLDMVLISVSPIVVMDILLIVILLYKEISNRNKQ